MIYFVEDDGNIRELVVYTLSQTGFPAMGFAHPSEFWAAMEKELPQMALLDIMLPEEDGLHILKRLRSSSTTRRLPVILLTAKGSEYDKVVGLDGGADDYLPKPFGMMELVARVRALFRRTEISPPAEAVYTVKNVTVCPAWHTVEVDGKEVSLTLKEFQVLCLLLENRGVVLTRDRILNQVWGYSFDGETRTVDVHIRTLRQKLERDGGESSRIIETIRGVGYKIGENRS